MPEIKKRNNKLKLGIPSRALQDQTLKLFESAGYKLEIDERLYKVRIDDPEIECFLANGKEVATQVGQGILDAGITSTDAVVESKTHVLQICDLNYSRHFWCKTRIVLAVPEKSTIKSIKGLRGKKIITRLPQITKTFLRKNRIAAEVVFSDESNEPRVPMLAHATVEFTTTGMTLKAHNLKILTTLMEASAILAASSEVLRNRWKKEKIENLAMLLQGARLAQDMVGLMLHASNDTLEKIFSFLPALKKPTVTQLRGENWFEVLTVVKKKELKELLPKLKAHGCTDIAEFPLNKVVP